MHMLSHEPLDDQSTLPTILGAGLELEELFRVTGAGNRARALYASEMPDAEPGELDRVARAASRDALRQVLRDRPAAPALAAPEIAEVDPWDVESDPADWPDSTDNWFFELDDDELGQTGPDELDTFAPIHPLRAIRVPSVCQPLAHAPLLSLDELIDQEAARMRAMGSHAGDLMGRTLAELAETVRSVQARTPMEYEARVEVLDVGQGPEPELGASGDWFDRNFEEGGAW